MGGLRVGREKKKPHVPLLLIWDDNCVCLYEYEHQAIFTCMHPHVTVTW